MNRLLITAAGTALFAGTLDIAAAMLKFFLSTGKNPLIVLQFIASGALGREAFDGGWLTAFYGLNFHFTIAFGWTMAYFLLFPKILFMAKSPYLSGSLYGILVWCGMNLLVLPLSNVTQRPLAVIVALEGMAILIVCIGLPVSLFARRYYMITQHH